MKQFFALLLCLLMMGCGGCETVPPGYVGIKVNLYGSNAGVEAQEMGVGRYTLSVGEQVHLFPMFEQNYTWTQAPTANSPQDESITFQTKEGLSVNADVGITFHINPGKAASVFQKYRRGTEEIVDTFLRNSVRDALNDYASTATVEAIYGEGKARMMDEVQRQIQAQLDRDQVGITVTKIYLVNSLRLPEKVTAALNAKLEATQRAQQRENEVREAEAEGKKALATAEAQAKAVLLAAESQAKANRLLSESLTPTLVQYRLTEKWDGRLPQLSGGAVPLISLPTPPNK